MTRKLIIDGSAVYELDEECMLKRKKDEKNRKEEEAHRPKEQKNAMKK